MQLHRPFSSKERFMRILVVGAGATGGLFGGLLDRTGRDVTFLVRGARAAQLREHGLRVKSPNGDFAIMPKLAQAGGISSHFDVILLGLKAHALDGALEHFAPAVGPQTMIVPMLNGMRHIDLLVGRFGEAPVLGGVCFVAGTLDDAGTIVQLNEMQELIYGERSGEMSPRIRELDGVMQGAGFTARSSEHIMREMWEKWVFLASLAASTCLLRGSVGAIMGAGGAPIVRSIFDECVATARAAGYPPREEFLLATRARLTAAGSPLTASMFRDLQQGRPVEAYAILGDLVARAHTFNIDVPLLHAAFVQLMIYERGRTA
jgi:2-dehydropantoate 2-reductase